MNAGTAGDYRWRETTVKDQGAMMDPNSKESKLLKFQKDQKATEKLTKGMKKYMDHIAGKIVLEMLTKKGGALEQAVTSAFKAHVREFHVKQSVKKPDAGKKRVSREKIHE